MIVCLSQAPQNGWETWFSLDYGTKFSKMTSKVRRAKSFDIKKRLIQLKKIVKETKLAVKTPPLQGSAAMKYYPVKLVNAREAEIQLEMLEYFIV
mmetsp:Transcript_21037/g.25502  ORF Transcript_21037/g.25502 Transcript_21037/m.25502 type:complete len:95 (+) Transcript_21037:261-545(+)